MMTRIRVCNLQRIHHDIEPALSDAGDIRYMAVRGAEQDRDLSHKLPNHCRVHKLHVPFTLMCLFRRDTHEPTQWKSPTLRQPQ